MVVGGCPWGWGCADALGRVFGTQVGRAWPEQFGGNIAPAGSRQLRTNSASACSSQKGQPAVVCAGMTAGGCKRDIPNILYMTSRAELGQKDVQESGLTLQKRRTQCCVCHMGSSNHKL